MPALLPINQAGNLLIRDGSFGFVTVVTLVRPVTVVTVVPLVTLVTVVTVVPFVRLEFAGFRLTRET